MIDIDSKISRKDLNEIKELYSRTSINSRASVYISIGMKILRYPTRNANFIQFSLNISVVLILEKNISFCLKALSSS